MDKLFWQYPVITEKTFYEQNKGDSNYVGVPWATIIDRRYNLNEIYGWVKARYSGEQNYTCCQHISFRKLIPLFRALNIVKVFTPHKKIGENQIQNIQLIPCPLYAVNVEDPTRNKIFQGIDLQNVHRPIWFSFIGGYQPDYLTDTRKRLIKKYGENSRQDIVVKHSGDWHFNDIVYNRMQNKAGKENITSRHEQNTEAYNKVLLESRFSLCPSGTGPNSIRFWESLAVGAIPVVLSDTMDLPADPRWKKCIIRIPERNLDKLEAVLGIISLEKETQMRQVGMEVYLSLLKFASQT